MPCQERFKTRNLLSNCSNSGLHTPFQAETYVTYQTDVNNIGFEKEKHINFLSNWLRWFVEYKRERQVEEELEMLEDM
ncbi:hypothetical protein Dsin_013979 [Dipteronia sinensis]|uniref:Uncharacterized protein n=1 Tax=Dipteronia sinensis TaxID=43782 RepID=A0AAE0AM78_9ROSI|nr:hypothetical protein Dsin_013979 [Dipteronia sinensis]